MARAKKELTKRDKAAIAIVRSAERRLEKIYFEYEVKVQLQRKRRRVVITCEDVAAVVSRVLNVPMETLVSKRRGKQAVSDARHIAIAITCDVTKYTIYKIGEYYSRDHSTIIHARDNARSLRLTNTAFRAKYDQCEKAWNSHYRKQLRNAKPRKTQAGDRAVARTAAKLRAHSSENAG